MSSRFLYVMGSASGIGKSTVCLGLLAHLLAEGYRPEQLAYIKPMTQCMTPQLVAQFCEQMAIDYKAIDGLIFSKGFTRDFIAGRSLHSSALLETLLNDIRQTGSQKSCVIVDGIGGPAVGSVIGVSNVDIALALQSQVIFVEKAGVGAAIDSTVLNVSFMQNKGLKNIGLVYNHLSATPESDVTQKALSKRLAEILPDTVLLGFLSESSLLHTWVETRQQDQIARWNTRFMDLEKLSAYYPALEH